MQKTIKEKIEQNSYDNIQDIQNGYKDYKIYKEAENIYINIDILISFMEKIERNPNLDEKAINSLKLYLKDNMPPAIIEDIKHIIKGKEKENYVKFAIQILNTTENSLLFKFALIILSNTEKSKEFKNQIMEISKSQEYVLYAIENIKEWDNKDKFLFEILKNSTAIGQILAIKNIEKLDQNQRIWLIENIENIIDIKYVAKEVLEKSKILENIEKYQEKAIKLIVLIMQTSKEEGVDFSYIEDKLDIILESVKEIANEKQVLNLYTIVEALENMRKKDETDNNYNYYIQEIYFLLHKKEALEIISRKVKSQEEPWQSIKRFLGVKQS